MTITRQTGSPFGVVASSATPGCPFSRTEYSSGGGFELPEPRVVELHVEAGDRAVGLIEFLVRSFVGLVLRRLLRCRRHARWIRPWILFVVLRVFAVVTRFKLVVTVFRSSIVKRQRLRDQQFRTFAAPHNPPCPFVKLIDLSVTVIVLIVHAGIRFLGIQVSIDIPAVERIQVHFEGRHDGIGITEVDHIHAPLGNPACRFRRRVVPLVDDLPSRL